MYTFYSFIYFIIIFSFIYSRREGTPAAKLDFVLSDEEIHRNFDELLEVQNNICWEKNLEYEGNVVKVLVDSVSKRQNMNTLSARTATNKR